MLQMRQACSRWICFVGEYIRGELCHAWYPEWASFCGDTRSSDRIDTVHLITPCLGFGVSRWWTGLNSLAASKNGVRGGTPVVSRCCEFHCRSDSMVTGGCASSCPIFCQISLAISFSISSALFRSSVSSIIPANNKVLKPGSLARPHLAGLWCFHDLSRLRWCVL